jgi:hypothetical protein
VRPTVVRHACHGVVAVLEHDAAENEGCRDVEAGQRDSDPAGDERPVARCAHYEPEQFEKHDREAGREERDARPEHSRLVERDSRRDEQAAGKQRQRNSEQARVPDVVAQHHGQQMEGGRCHREWEQPERDEVDGKHRHPFERLSVRDRRSGEDERHGCREPPHERDCHVGRKEPKWNRAADRTAAAEERERARTRTAAHLAAYVNRRFRTRARRRSATS